jgi:L-asparaginase II
MTITDMNPVVAEVIRPGFAESRHRGTVAGLAADGSQVISAGRTDVPFLPRSANKPLQAAAMLRCPASWPLDARTARELTARGEGTARIRMNCSGKHAAMLATCALNGWPTRGYLDPGHPLQQAIRATVAELAGQFPAATAVDGCGAPAFALTLSGLARVRAVGWRG